MKTGTSCTRCANAAICPAYDPRMLYGFRQGFVEIESDPQGQGHVGENLGGSINPRSYRKNDASTLAQRGRCMMALDELSGKRGLV